MPRTIGLSRDKIAAAALELADSEGLDAFSMRRLALALGVGVMSLYNHVRDKADVEQLLLDKVFAPIAPLGHDGDWETRAKAALRAMRDALNSHPGLLPLLLRRSTTSEAALRPIESLLSALVDGGFEGPSLLCAYHTLFGYLTGFVMTDLSGALSIRNRRTVTEVSQSVLELDPQRFPLLRACAMIATSSDSTEEFEYGLSAVLTGLKMIEGSPRPISG